VTGIPNFAPPGTASATIAAAALCVVFSLALMPLARRLGWMDQPLGRKAHGHPTPLVGGVAVFLACWLVLGLAAPPGLAPLLAAAAVVLVSGLVDDRWPQSAWLRFVVQAAACLVMIWYGNVELHDFGRLFWDRGQGLGPLAVPVTVFAALGVINAMNMIDGLDGLCGSVFLVCCGAMAFLAARAGQGQAVFLLLTAGGAVLGFLALNARLPWNPRARVFLGDSGSALLGFFLAWLFIDLGNGPDRAFAPMTAVWIIGVPLYDTSYLIYSRWRLGQSAFAADQQHLHHAFLRAGFSVRTAWLGVVGLCAASALAGILSELWRVPEYWRFYAYIAVGLIYVHTLRRTWRTGRFLGRPIDPAAPPAGTNG